MQLAQVRGGLIFLYCVCLIVVRVSASARAWFHLVKLREVLGNRASAICTKGHKMAQRTSVFAELFARRFWIMAYALLIAGFIIPGNYEALRPTIPFFLCGILFFSCLKITTSDVVVAVQQRSMWRMLGWLSLVKLLFLPAIAYGVTLIIAPSWAAGILLVSMMPAGFSTLAFADLYHGNRLLALLLMISGSLVVPFTAPFVVGLATGETLSASTVAHEMGYVALLLFSPLLLAQVVRYLCPQFIEQRMTWWGPCSIACVCGIIFVAVVVNRVSWAHMELVDIFIPLALSTLATVIFIIGGWIQGRFLTRPDAVTFMCTAIYMNNGLSVAFATKFYADDPHMLLPSVMMQFPMTGCVALVGWWYARGRGGAK
jgi:predicted Na+-dependent transporter